MTKSSTTPIVAEFGPSVQEYIELELEQHCPRPEACAICQAEGQIIGHGYYLRKPKDWGRVYLIRVKRWRCKACGKTFGCLPSFVLRFRHYLVEVIQIVLVGRLEVGYSWSESEELYSEEGVPAKRSFQRWCRAFEGNAPEWLAGVERELAQQDSQSPWLDAIATPGGEPIQATSCGRALLRACMHLLAWGKMRWDELARYGLNERLRFLWHWGAKRGYARLV